MQGGGSGAEDYFNRFSNIKSCKMATHAFHSENGGSVQTPLLSNSHHPFQLSASPFNRRAFPAVWLCSVILIFLRLPGNGNGSRLNQRAVPLLFSCGFPSPPSKQEHIGKSGSRPTESRAGLCPGGAALGLLTHCGCADTGNSRQIP